MKKVDYNTIQNNFKRVLLEGQLREVEDQSTELWADWKADDEMIESLAQIVKNLGGWAEQDEEGVYWLSAKQEKSNKRSELLKAKGAFPFDPDEVTWDMDDETITAINLILGKFNYEVVENPEGEGTDQIALLVRKRGTKAPAIKGSKFLKEQHTLMSVNANTADGLAKLTKLAKQWLNAVTSRGPTTAKETDFKLLVDLGVLVPGTEVGDYPGELPVVLTSHKTTQKLKSTNPKLYKLAKWLEREVG